MLRLSLVHVARFLAVGDPRLKLGAAETVGRNPEVLMMVQVAHADDAAFDNYAGHDGMLIPRIIERTPPPRRKEHVAVAEDDVLRPRPMRHAVQYRVNVAPRGNRFDHQLIVEVGVIQNAIERDVQRLVVVGVAQVGYQDANLRCHSSIHPMPEAVTDPLNPQ